MRIFRAICMEIIWRIDNIGKFFFNVFICIFERSKSRRPFWDTRIDQKPHWHSLVGFSHADLISETETPKSKREHRVLANRAMISIRKSCSPEFYTQKLWMVLSDRLWGSRQWTSRWKPFLKAFRASKIAYKPSAGFWPLESTLKKTFRLIKLPL